MDKRADLWAFGCVLYEMLTGRPAFARDTVTDTLAAIVGHDVAWDRLSQTTPLAVKKLVRRCLAKDLRQRLSDARDIRLEIEDALNTPAAELAASPAWPRRTSWRVVAVVAAVTFIITSALTGVVVWMARRSAPPRVTRTTIAAVPPPAFHGVARDLAISADGMRVVYPTLNGTLVVRALDQLVSATIGELDRPTHPFFSPDGKWIAFINDGSGSGGIVKKVPAGGGSAVTLAPVGGTIRGATWGSDDSIVFANGDPSTGLFRVPAAGGKPEVLTTPDPAAGEVDHVWPEAGLARSVRRLHVDVVGGASAAGRPHDTRAVSRSA